MYAAVYPPTTHHPPKPPPRLCVEVCVCMRVCVSCSSMHARSRTYLTLTPAVNHIRSRFISIYTFRMRSTHESLCVCVFLQSYLVWYGYVCVCTCGLRMSIGYVCVYNFDMFGDIPLRVYQTNQQGYEIKILPILGKIMRCLVSLRGGIDSKSLSGACMVV